MNRILLRPFIVLLIALGLSSCAQYRLAKADQAYDRMAYAQASERYEAYLAQHMEYDAAVRAADSYRQQNRLERAAHWYAAADSVAPLNAEQRFDRAKVLMGLGKPEKAEQELMSVLQERPEHQEALALYGSCKGYQSFFKDTTRFTVAELPLPGVRNVFSALPYQNGLLVVAEREAGLDKSNPWTGGSFLDICYTEKHTLANWSEPKAIPGEVNGRYHEGPVALSSDGRVLYFTRSNYYKVKLRKDDKNISHLKLFRAEMQPNGEWGNIRAFAFNGEDHSVGHPALSADGKTLYFASDMPGSLGGSDLWKCTDTGSGWSTPQNLGATVNTAGNELFPTINGEVLYFSSSAHTNMGGLDIFSTHPEGNGWSDPENLGYPINTTHDDFAFILSADEKSGYLSSDRSSSDRIHYFFVNDPLLFVEGAATDDSTGLYLPNVEATLTDLETMEDTTILTGPDGAFKFKLDPGTNYDLRVTGPGLIAQSRTFSTSGAVKNTTYHQDFQMSSVYVGENIAINNIYYDYDKYDIRPDAALELDHLIKLFSDNPHITFELGSHTDARGGDMYNLVLSDARANSAVNYLIKHGVNPDRIVAKGYGETVLVNGCANGVKCTEEDHQANRRTEFKVLNIGTLARN
ncbi:MAG: OmpA family protein [Flavobacteriales bacterium]|nr:OmpA family protein [Flavobacteriales bacterium]MBK9286454.1 OmpA family protein [Flavobacteriales bacterium]MBL0034821.1 OmpA family protein [Flavobacteriales bacterium]